MPITLEPLAPQEAIDAVRAKGFDLAPSFSWRDRFQEDHATSFTAAKAMSADILDTLYGGVERALVEGQTFRQFRNDLQPLLQKAGWWGRKEQVDPKTGETRTVQLGSPRRLRLIFDVNLRQAYAAGQWARIARSKDSRPYLRYSALLDDHTRPEHRAWDGVILPVDDPFWDTHMPMNGWRCRCSVRQLSAAELRRRGLTVSKRPPTPTRAWRNDRTGATHQIPKGVDPGFAYNPGRAALHHNAARVFAEKSAAWPPDIAAAATAASGRVLANAQGAAFRDWLRALADGATPRGATQVISIMSRQTLDGLRAAGASPASGAIVIRDDRLAHMLRDAKRAPIPRAMIERLPELMASPRAVLRDRRDGDLLYIVDIDGQSAIKVVIRADLRQKAQTPLGRARFTASAVRTAGRVRTADLRGAQYKLISGSLD